MKQEQSKIVTVHHTTGQKIVGALALAALFVCGVLAGVAINAKANSGRAVKEIAMTETQCDLIASQITMVAQGYGGCSGDACVTKLRELNDIYTKNCAGRTFEVEEPKPASKAEDIADKRTCEVIEELLSERLNVMNGGQIAMHSNNIEVYKSLAEKGCPENIDKYNDMISRESAIIDALKSNASSENTQTCAEIEKLLLQQLAGWDDGDAYNSASHIERAKIYANLSERGCPENSQSYVDLAARELEIARAVRDDNFSDSEINEVSDTYKRIQMKQAASEILNKVQKLADPAIDFFIQAQKIIEE